MIRFLILIFLASHSHGEPCNDLNSEALKSSIEEKCYIGVPEIELLNLVEKAQSFRLTNEMLQLLEYGHVNGSDESTFILGRLAYSGGLDEEDREKRLYLLAKGITLLSIAIDKGNIKAKEFYFNNVCLSKTLRHVSQDKNC